MPGPNPYLHPLPPAVGLGLSVCIGHIATGRLPDTFFDVNNNQPLKTEFDTHYGLVMFQKVNWSIRNLYNPEAGAPYITYKLRFQGALDFQVTVNVYNPQHGVAPTRAAAVGALYTYLYRNDNTTRQTDQTAMPPPANQQATQQGRQQTSRQV